MTAKNNYCCNNLLTLCIFLTLVSPFPIIQNGFLEFQATESALPVDIKWLSFGKLFRLAVAGLGVITLGAIFTHRS